MIIDQQKVSIKAFPAIIQTVNEKLIYLQPFNVYINLYPVFFSSNSGRQAMLFNKAERENNLGHSLCLMVIPQQFWRLKIFWDAKPHLYPDFNSSFKPDNN